MIRLELGKCYGVLRSDGSHTQFRFIGNSFGDNEVYGAVGDNRIPLFELLRNVTAYWEVECP